MSRNVTRSIGAFLAFVIVLSACQAAPQTTQSTPEPSELDELRIATSQFGNESLDPIMGPQQNGRYLRLIFDELLGVDYTGTQLSKETGIARDWAVSADSKTFTLTIREGVPWQDPKYGNVTAEDVAFTLKRLCDPAAGCPKVAPKVTSARGSLIAGLIESVTASGNQVEVRLRRPYVTFLSLLSPFQDLNGLVVSKKYFDEVGPDAFSATPMGSGPYKLVERQAGAFLKLEQAFPEHFAIGKPRFKRVTMRLVTESSSRVAMLRAGDADWADVSIEDVPQLSAAGLQVFRSANLDPFYVRFQPGPWKAKDVRGELQETSDINLRKALSYAINREELSKVLFKGQAPAMGNFLSGQIGVTARPPLPYDVAKAKEFLDRTPWGAGGKKLTLQIQASPRDQVPQMLTVLAALQDSWKKIGVDAVLTYRDFGAFRSDWVAGKLPAPVLMVIVSGASPDLLPVLQQGYTCNSLFNSACDPGLEKLLAQWAAATTSDEYARLADQVDKYMVDNLIVIPIVAIASTFAAGKQVRSDYSPGSQFLDFNTRGLVWNPKK